MNKKINNKLLLYVVAIIMFASMFQGITLASSGKVYNIYTVEDLFQFAEENKSFIALEDTKVELMNDIDFDGIEMKPIPQPKCFEGNGHILKNIKINAPDNDNVALFKLGVQRYDVRFINNLTLENVYIVGNNNVSALFSNNFTHVENCHITGIIKGNENVGAFAGSIKSLDVGDVGYYGLMDCSSNVVVIGDKNVGGLIGLVEKVFVYEESTIKPRDTHVDIDFEKYNYQLLRCYSNSYLYGRDNVGGLVGNVRTVEWYDEMGKFNYVYEEYICSINITNCYSMGNIESIGENNGKLIGGGNSRTSIRNCYSTLTLPNNLKNLAVNDTPYIRNSYYEVNDSIVKNSKNGNSRTMEQLLNEANYVGWDFKDVWGIDEGVNSGYPYLVHNIPYEYKENIVMITNVNDGDSITMYVRDGEKIKIEDLEKKGYVYSLLKDNGEFFDTDDYIFDDLYLNIIYKPIKNVINIGDYISFGSYLGNDIIWRCVGFEKVIGYNNDGVPIVDSTITTTDFEPGYIPLLLADNSVFDVFWGYDSDWNNSVIRKILNSSQESMNYTVNSETCQGFLFAFTNKEKSLIQPVNQKNILFGFVNKERLNPQKDGYYEYEKYALQYNTNIDSVVQNYKTALSNYIQDSVFLLDVQQIHNVYKNSDILGNSYYIARDKNGLKCISWLRTQNTKIEKYARAVFTNGDIYSLKVFDTGYGIRPAMFFNSATEVVLFGNGSKTNPYKIGE